jgi:azurin
MHTLCTDYPRITRAEQERAMPTQPRWGQILAVLALALALGACGGGAAPSGGPSGVTIGTVGEEFKFDADGLTFKAGEPVAVTVQNNSATSQHNWVLVNGGEDVAARINDAGLTADAGRGYVPDDPAVLAHSRLLEGKQSETVQFTAPAPGIYTYLCTFPGHFAAGMKGNLVVAQ